MKIIAYILAVSALLCLLSACGAPKKGETETTAEETRQSLNPTGESYKDGVVTEMHLYSLAAYFSGDYTAADAGKYDLLHATAEFLYLQRQDTVSVSADDSTVFSVSAEELESTMQLLFGEKLSLDDYAGFMKAELSDLYDSENDIYTFKYDSEAWSQSKLIPLFDREIEQEETLEGVTAVLYAADAEGNEKRLSFSFLKTVRDGYLYLTLESVKAG